MAVTTQVFHSDGWVALALLYPGERREWVDDDPDDRLWPFLFRVGRG